MSSKKQPTLPSRDSLQRDNANPPPTYERTSSPTPPPPAPGSKKP